MALRSTKLWRSLASRLNPTSAYTTSTQPKMRPQASTLSFSDFHDGAKKPMVTRNRDPVPLFMAVSMISLSVSLGLYTAWEQLKHSPTVSVRKTRREKVVEVDEPEQVAEEAEKFMINSLFRKIAHLQEFDTGDSAIAGESSSAAPSDVAVGGGHARLPRRVESLKSLGV